MNKITGGKPVRERGFCLYTSDAFWLVWPLTQKGGIWEEMVSLLAGETGEKENERGKKTLYENEFLVFCITISKSGLTRSLFIQQ